MALACSFGASPVFWLPMDDNAHYHRYKRGLDFGTRGAVVPGRGARGC